MSETLTEIDPERESTIEENKDDRPTNVDNFLLNQFKQQEEQQLNQNGTNETEEGKENLNIVQSNKNNKNEFKKLKIILLGEKGVGKTSLINRYVDNKFNAFGQDKLGDEKKKKMVEVDQNLTVDLEIWDTTNEEKLGTFTKDYYRDAYGAIVVYDLTNDNSFSKVKFWLKELDSKAPRDIIICILGNKADLTADRTVKYEDVKNIAGDNLHYEVSAKTGNNISLAFEQLTYGILEKQKEEERNPDKVARGKEGRKTTDLNDINKDLGKKKCC